MNVVLVNKFDKDCEISAASVIMENNVSLTCQGMERRVRYYGGFLLFIGLEKDRKNEEMQLLPRRTIPV